MDNNVVDSWIMVTSADEEFNEVYRNEKIGSGYSVVVKTEQGLVSNVEQINKVGRGVEKGLELFEKITDSNVERYWPGGEVDIKIVKGALDSALWHSNLAAHRNVLDQSQETVTAGLLHEFVENYQEENGLTSMDVTTMMLEFLFCGDDRESVFQGCLKNSENKTQSRPHDVGFASIVKDYLGEEWSENLDENWEKIKGKKTDLSENQKIEVAKRYINSDEKKLIDKFMGLQ